MIVGVLAFQGDFAEHHSILRSLGVPSIDIRTLEDFSKVEALIIPGGESTVISSFLTTSGIGLEMQRRLKTPDSRLRVFGTCAGAIVLARKVTGKNAPRGLGLIDVTIDRNAYGSQIDSFETELKVKGLQRTIEVSFIRAPIITSVGRGVEVLSTYKDHPVLVKQGSVTVATFHPEVRLEKALHQLFLR